MDTDPEVQNFNTDRERMARMNTDQFKELDGPVQFELLPDGRRARLTRAYRVAIRGVEIEVPEGFVTDFASVPRLLWRILPPWDRHAPAAVIHDWLYKSGLMPRAEADLIFLWVMEELDVKKWKRRSMYWGVRIGGWKPWGEYREAEADDGCRNS